MNTNEDWNAENADDGGPQFEDLFPAFDQVEADRQENEARTKRNPK